ncbi:uncharacterized protein CXorf38 homolog [Leptodactylus fuscus]|uniref:uncharacterized protein CXorf38 homolog n=1 Tax=Leptodactylus fuscus TaxID=238119 RepID=UPI003F4EE5C2
MALPALLARLQCKEYKNWMKAGMCLQMLQSPLQGYIDREMQSFHRQLAGKIKAPRHRKRCQCRAIGKKFEPACPVCAQWKELILSHHNNRKGEIHWGNSDPSLWPTHYWEVAKVYMPHGQAKLKGSKNCDPAALLNLINNCDHFKVSNTRVKEIIKCRNELMHSCNMKVSSSWLSSFGQKMYDLIAEFTHVPDLVKEGDKMQEVLLSNWNVGDLGVYEVDGPVKLQNQNIHTLKGYSEILEKTLSPYEAERLLIEQMIQELYLKIEEQGSVTKEDGDKVSQLKLFLSQNEDLKYDFQEDLVQFDILLKNHDVLQSEGWIHKKHLAAFVVVLSLAILTTTTTKGPPFAALSTLLVSKDFHLLIFQVSVIVEHLLKDLWLFMCPTNNSSLQTSDGNLKSNVYGQLKFKQDGNPNNYAVKVS